LSGAGPPRRHAGPRYRRGVARSPSVACAGSYAGARPPPNGRAPARSGDWPAASSDPPGGWAAPRSRSLNRVPAARAMWVGGRWLAARVRPQGHCSGQRTGWAIPGPRHWRAWRPPWHRRVSRDLA